jgi:hypothetical protein
VPAPRQPKCRKIEEKPGQSRRMSGMMSRDAVRSGSALTARKVSPPSQNRADGGMNPFEFRKTIADL